MNKDKDLRQSLAEVEGALLRHATRYPLMQPQDAVKLLYQSEFGAGHLLDNPEENLSHLRLECQTAAPDDESPLFETIGGGFSRLNLKAAAAKESTVLAIHRIFAAGAAKTCGSMEGFAEKLAMLLRLTEAGRLPFSLSACADYLEQYRKQGMPAVSHSDSYRAAYKPAYRVVPSAYAASFGLICEIERRLAQGQRMVIAIDGLCGAGKTTLAGLLAGLYDCTMIPMDSFFLPPEKRTPQRLAEPGGNIDYERFYDEVAQHMASGQPFAYRVFDCSTMTFAQTRQVQPKAITICEGSYSQHPHFGNVYDIRVFVTCNEQQQKERLLARSGPELYERFVAEWIPLEQAYFKACRIRQQSHFVIDTSTR